MKDVFDSAIRENKRLVDELRKHEATYPEVKKEFDRLDAECISQAHDCLVAREAQSPTLVFKEGKLKQTRWQRDGVMNTFKRIRNRLIDQVTATSQEDAGQFHADTLEKIRNIASLYRFEKTEFVYNRPGDKAIRVTVKHNAAALKQFQDFMFSAIQKIASMRLGYLSDLRAQIEDYERQFALYKTSTMEAIEVSPERAAEMAPQAPRDAALDRINNLNSRLNTLEAR